MKFMNWLIRTVVFTAFLLAMLCGAIVAFVLAKEAGMSTLSASAMSAFVICVPSIAYIFWPWGR